MRLNDLLYSKSEEVNKRTSEYVNTWSLASHGSWCRSGEGGPGGLVPVSLAGVGAERASRC